MVTSFRDRFRLDKSPSILSELNKLIKSRIVYADLETRVEKCSRAVTTVEKAE